MTENLPEGVERSLQSYERNLKNRQLIGFIAPLYCLEEGLKHLSREQRIEVTQRVVGEGIDELVSMKSEGQKSPEFYHFVAGNIAAYLQNIRHLFPDIKAYQKFICFNLALLVAESKSPLASNILKDCLDIIKDWKTYRELYD